MRPIGLMCPSSKALAGALRQKMMAQMMELLRWLPQFAYAPGRGTLIRVHRHFLEVGDIIRDNRVNRFQKHQGKQAKPCCGGISMSLDLSKAFDKVHRPKLYSSLADNGVDHTTIAVLQSLHQNAQYRFRVGSLTGSVTTNNGIKQGCKDRTTAVLLRLEGRQVKALLRELTYEQAGVEYLRVEVHGHQRGIPIKSHHGYLGSAVMEITSDMT